jgi:hypothetical protein
MAHTVFCGCSGRHSDHGAICNIESIYVIAWFRGSHNGIYFNFSRPWSCKISFTSVLFYSTCWGNNLKFPWNMHEGIRFLILWQHWRLKLASNEMSVIISDKRSKVPGPAWSISYLFRWVWSKLHMYNYIHQYRYCYIKKLLYARTNVSIILNV